MDVERHHVRAARADDGEAVVEIARVSGLFPPDGGLDVVVAAVDASLRRSAAARWVVVEDDRDHRPLGVAHYAPEPVTDGTWNLLMLVVHPDHQGRGLGSALVAHVEDELRREGRRLLLIETSGTPEFTAQRAFYDRLGYIREGGIRDYYGPGDDQVVLSKHLVAADPGSSSVPDAVRVAVPGDLPRVLALAEAFYREEGFSTPRSTLQANLGELIASEAAHVTVVDGEDDLLAFAITTTGFGLESGLTAELEDLYVVPRRRREGLAGRLVEESVAWARRRAAACLEIVVAPHGHDVDHLRRYYRARGFADEGRRLLVRPLA